MSPSPVDRRALGLLAALTLALHLAAPTYGYFRDELYYLACAAHPDLGYVDHPPLFPWLAALVRATLGSSLPALRTVPALAAAAVVYLTGMAAADLGGRRYAQVLAGLAVLFAPVYLGIASVFTLNAIDVLAWAACFRLAIHALRGEPRRWLGFGLIAGLGLLNKISVLFLGFGLAVGLVLARRWDVLRDRYLWLGGALAVLLFAPHLAWQVVHGFPTLEFMANASADKNVALSPLAFLGQQILQVGPGALPIWLTGLLTLLLAPAARPLRPIAWTYLVTLAVMLLTAAKPYYLAPAYTVLFAAGAAALAARTAGRPGLRAVLVALVVLPGLLAAPIARPLLPIETYIRYAAALGFTPTPDERHTPGRLPQRFADMHGWPEFAATIARVHQALPAGERALACVVGRNYGEAGAIDLFGPPLGLPPAISTHNNYFLWGPRGCTGEVVIVPARERGDLERLFARVELAATFDCGDCMPYEDDLPIWIARQPRAALAATWPALKHYD